VHRRERVERDRDDDGCGESHLRGAPVHVREQRQRRDACALDHIHGQRTKGFSFLLKQDGAVAGTALFSIGDSTAGVTRGIVTATISAAGVVTAVGSSGATVLRVESLADGVYRVHAYVTGTLAANVHAVYVANSGTATSYLISGIDVENGVFPTSLIPTTTATVTRAADVLTYNLLALPRAITIRTDALCRVSPNAATNYGVWGLGSAGPPYALGRYDGTTLQSHIQHFGSGSLVSSQTTTAPTYGQRTELRHVLRSTGGVIAALAVDGGAESATAVSTAGVLAAAWSDTALLVGNGGGQPATVLLRSLRIAADEQTLAYMRTG
jgi:hypothetical protein